jgi:RHS repeat-associated protein
VQASFRAKRPAATRANPEICRTTDVSAACACSAHRGRGAVGVRSKPRRRSLVCSGRFRPSLPCSRSSRKGKERDTETSNDDFGARYFSFRIGRWLSADWSAVPAPVPYANLSNPQTLNLYAMVRDNPETFADLDGHDCCDVWDAINFVVGALNAYGSDNLAGAGRQSQNTTAGNLGQAVGDTVATIEGFEKMGVGGTMVATSIPEDATGAGAVIGVPQAAAGTALETQGAVEGSQGLGNLIKDATAPMESHRTGDFTSAEKNQLDKANATSNGGQNKCTECGQDVQKVQNKAGQPTPGNQLQRHHDPMLSKGGNSQSKKNRVVCNSCHKKIHKQS